MTLYFDTKTHSYNQTPYFFYKLSYIKQLFFILIYDTKNLSIFLLIFTFFKVYISIYERYSMSHPQHILQASFGVRNNIERYSKPSRQKKKLQRINWHDAITCAIQIDLREYADRLEYLSEYKLGKNNYRIDLLVIKELTEPLIPQNIALNFRTFNLFEIKGIGSSITIDSYYKTIGYAGLFIDQTGSLNQYSSLDISLTLLSCHYSRALIRHLKKERKLTVEKFSPGVYYINKETFITQIIVTSELSPEENLYLYCLTNRLSDKTLATKLIEDYKNHQEQPLYNRYMEQLANTSINTKGGNTMICGILDLYNKCTEAIEERTRQEEAEYYLPKINLLSSQVSYLASLLEQHNIPFDMENIADT